MRIGVDARLLQFGDVQRGYGSYLRWVLLGLRDAAPDLELYFFRYQSRPLPEDLMKINPHTHDVPLAVAPVWHESGSIWSRRRMQLLPVIPGRAHWAYYRSQGKAIEAKAKELKLDVYFHSAPMFPDQGTLPKLSTPTVYVYYDAIPYLFRDRYIDTWDVDAKKLYLEQRASYQLADRVAAISESAREEAVSQFGLAPDKVLTARCSIDPNFGATIGPLEIEAVKARYRVRYPFFVFCSILDYHKNLRTAVEAVSRLIENTGKTYQLVVIGGLPDFQRDLVRGLAFDAGLTGREVVMTGHIPGSDLRALFQSASAIVSPSLAEGFGYPVLQGMVSRTPVVASDIPPYREILGQSGIRLDPLDVDAWANALERIVSEPGYAEALLADDKAVTQAFAAVNQGRQLLEIFKQAAGRG